MGEPEVDVPIRKTISAGDDDEKPRLDHRSWRSKWSRRSSLPDANAVAMNLLPLDHFARKGEQCNHEQVEGGFGSPGSRMQQQRRRQEPWY